MESLFIDWLTVPADLSQVFEIRKKVFVEEQNCTLEEEFDIIDKISEHGLLISKDHGALGTLRLYEKTPGQASIGRICLLKEYRGKGYGFFLVEQALTRFKYQGYPDVLIHAQTYAIPFYEKLGFKVISQEFMEDNIPHVKMVHTFEDS